MAEEIQEMSDNGAHPEELLNDDVFVRRALMNEGVDHDRLVYAVRSFVNKQYRPKIKPAIRRCFDEGDVSCETLIRLEKERQSERAQAHAGHFVRYVRVLARSSFFDLCRREGADKRDPRRRAELIDSSSDLLEQLMQRGEQGKTPDRGLLDIERAELLLSAVHGLPSPLNQILYFKYYMGLSSAEIGEILDIPASTVRNLLQEGLVKLRAVLARTGGFTTLFRRFRKEGDGS